LGFLLALTGGRVAVRRELEKMARAKASEIAQQQNMPQRVQAAE
jgi:hypothetical protein